MINLIRSLTISGIIIIALITDVGCFRDETAARDYNPNRNAAIDWALAANMYKDVFNLVFTAFTDPSLFATGEAQFCGASAAVDTVSKRITISFGDFFHLCPDQRYRQGRIYAAYDMHLLIPGATVLISYDSLYAESEIVEPDKALEIFFITAGNEFITNSGRDNLGHLAFNQYIENGIITDSSQRILTWNSDEIYTWIAGEATQNDHLDDLLEITGHTSVTSFTGTTLTTVVVEPLLNSFRCRWIVSGITEMNTPSLMEKHGIIDYIDTDYCSDIVNFVYGDIVLYDRLR